MPRPGGSTRQWRKARAHVWQRDAGLCRACGAATHLARCTPRGCPRCYQAGHRTPLARGGSDHPDNLVCLCLRCNLAMGSTDLDAYLGAVHASRAVPAGWATASVSTTQSGRTGCGWAGERC